jgi:uncharacterized membrane protein YdjX (TVP38/TMEM64 family)
MDKKNFKNIAKLTIGVVVIIGIWWVVRCQCINLKLFTPAAIRDYIQSFGKTAAIVYILAYTLNTISIFPPIAALSLTAGLVFGPVWGAIYLMIGAMLGTTSTFFISRLFGRIFVEKLLKGRFKYLDNMLEKRGFITVLFFRVVPIVPYEVLNYISGITKIKFKDYLLATLLGLIPGVTIAAFFGGTLGEIKSLKDLFLPKFILATLALIVIILVPVIYQYVKKKKRK